MLDIREIREKLGVSQAQLSEITNIRQHRLSSIELGKEQPSIEEINHLTKVFSDIRDGKILIRKKKRISKVKFNSSIISDNPRRCYERTSNNEEYLMSLKLLEEKFHQKKENRPTAISFFAGCGGLCYGITAAGFNIVATNELVEEYKSIYAENFPNANFLSNDIKNITDEEI